MSTLSLLSILLTLSFSEASTSVLRRAAGGRRSKLDQLYEDLLFNYIPEVRPSRHPGDVTLVEFTAYLIQILDLDEKNQILTTNLWLELEWTDHRLGWEPPLYDNVTAINLPSGDIWVPDIVMYNNAAGKPQITIFTDALVSHSGKIVWKPPMIGKSFCKVDIRQFPFDEQECHMKFGTWSYDAQYVDLGILRQHMARRDDNTTVHGVGMDLSFYYRSAEWLVLNITAVRHETVYATCCGQKIYVDITFYFTIERRPLFYMANMLFPCCGMSLLTVLAFYLPADSKQRMTLCISILVSLSVFFLLLCEIMPATSDGIPIMGRYILFNMIMISITVVMTVVTLNLHHRDANMPMSPLTRHVFVTLLSKWFRIGYGERRVKKDAERRLRYCLPRGVMPLPGADPMHESVSGWCHEQGIHAAGCGKASVGGPLQLSKAWDWHQNSTPNPSITFPNPINPLRSDTLTLHGRDRIAGSGAAAALLDAGTLETQRTAARLVPVPHPVHYLIQARREEHSMDWSILSIVIDRICLVIFTTITILALIWLMFQVPTHVFSHRPSLDRQEQHAPLGYAATGAAIRNTNPSRKLI